MNSYLLFIGLLKIMVNSKPQRSFILGDKWIYFKLYVGPQTADRILDEIVNPVVNKLLAKNKIDQWFFIRYADPDLHLRVRLHLTSQKYIGFVIRILNKAIIKYFDQELIWKVQIDTYHRELERYGYSTIELSEQLFFLDSKLFIKILPYFKNPNGENQRWLFALKSIDCLLDCFQYSKDQRLCLLQCMTENFGKEFNVNRSLKDQINRKFSKEWENIKKSLDSIIEPENIIAPLLSCLSEHKKETLPVAKEILEICKERTEDIHVNDLISSYIHMMMNRLFRSKQRIHELVLYNFLYRYYKSSIERMKTEIEISVQNK
jgi:thiopeptide-type bacteriocin biosynthesis protein